MIDRQRGYCNLTSGNSVVGATTRMDERKDTVVEAVLEHLIEHGPGDIATVFGRAFELAMQIERERFLRAGAYERTADRRGYANGSHGYFGVKRFF